jgi:hypothetical protein
MPHVFKDLDPRAPLFRVLEVLDYANAYGRQSRHEYAYGPFPTLRAARLEESRVHEAHKDFRRLGTIQTRIQTTPANWQDVEG